MKKIWIPLFMLLSLQSKGITMKWDGEGNDGLWNTAANWDGNTVPGISDQVILDHTFLSESYSVQLPPGAITVTVQSLIIDPGGGNAIVLILPSGNTADPGLQVTGIGDALVLNDKAMLKNSSGASAGAGIAISNTFRINNGGRYVHNTNRGNASIVSRLSAAAGTESGIFEFDVPAASYTLSLTGRTYGTLVLSSAARGSMVTYVGTGANPLHINGNLLINTQVAFRTGMTADCIIHGNYHQSPSSIVDLQTASGNNAVKIAGHVFSKGVITKSGSGSPVLQMNGLANQDISIDTLANAITFSVNNPAGITLIAPLVLPHHLQFIHGKIRTSAVNLLIMADNTIHTGSSATNFIEGPVKKIGDEDFYFPVGKGSLYTPVALAGGSGASVTDEFTVEYIRANPQSLYGANYEITPPPGHIDHISYVEHWIINSNTGMAVSKYLTLPVNCESFCRDFSSLFVTWYDPGTSEWKTAGRSGTTSSVPAACSGYLAGTITSNPVASFSVFTLATSQTEAINPLPVNLVSFNVARISSRKALISWRTACCEIMDFEVQRAGPDRLFYTIGRINGNSNNFFYDHEDNFLTDGINYYRLKMIDNQINVSYSKTLSLLNQANGVSISSLLPAVVSSEMKITIVSPAAQPIDIVILDIQGRVTRKQHQYLQAGTTTLTLRLSDLHTGIYYLFGIAAGERTEAMKFFKN